MTLLSKALLNGNVNPKLYSFLALNYWGLRSSEAPNNVVVVNNNEPSAQQKVDLLDALRLSQDDVHNDTQKDDKDV